MSHALFFQAADLAFHHRVLNYEGEPDAKRSLLHFFPRCTWNALAERVKNLGSGETATISEGRNMPHGLQLTPRRLCSFTRQRT